MKIYPSSFDFFTEKQTVVTIGSFDGFHIGHQKIIDKVAQTAISNNLESLVVTFFPHPRMVLQENYDIKMLNTIREKTTFLEKSKIDNLIIQPFTSSFSLLSAEDFVKTILVEKFKAKIIIIGYDHKFGNNRSAGIEDLIKFGKKYGFGVEQISAQEMNDIAISSTKIRKALENGNISIANQYLGYNYFLSGKIVKGQQLGRTIGFATANIFVEETEKLIPKNGVYMVTSFINNHTYFGVMNIGNRPTVNGKKTTIEVHFINFDQDIYNQTITVELVNFIREEQKFDSLDLLKNQIAIDKQIAIDFFSKK